MARADTATLLSLDRYAQIMGINGAHFNGAAGGSILPAGGACPDIWWQHDWQAHDRTSRESLARAIYQAEQEIALAVGYFPAPTWIYSDIYRTERPYRRDAFGDGLNIRLMNQSIILRWGKLIQAGRRAVSLIASPAVYGPFPPPPPPPPPPPADYFTISDLDGDGYSETVTITLTPATIPTDLCEVKVYFYGHLGDPEWEVRPLRTIRQSGANVIITLWAWQIIEPAKWEAFPTGDGMKALDIMDASNYVGILDIYREYNDFSQSSATFFWEPTVSPDVCSCNGAGCAACMLTSQDGCAGVRDPDRGIIVPQPATYADGEWSANTYAVCRQPDLVKLYYLCGDQDQLYFQGRTCDPLSTFWAETIAWLATARLERPFCACGNLTALAQDLRVDYAFTSPDGSGFQVAADDLDNPFGTRKGELRAWRRVQKFVRKRGKVAVI